MTQTPTRRLLAAYRRAGVETTQRGRDWYDAALRWASDLAEETGYTVDQAVAVMAITSQGAQLAQNMRHTERALRSGGTERCGRFPDAQGPKIAAVLASPEAAAEYVTGPKCGAFHRAILGDEDALVLDRWALFAAGHSDRDKTPTLDVRRKCEAAYRRAAELAGETVRDFQAIVWIACREKSGRNYFDLTGGTVAAGL